MRIFAREAWGGRTMHVTAEIPFTFEIPFEAFTKAGEKGKERRIGGIISTESVDRQGEVLLQDGLDFSYFLKNGWFNDNHSKKTTDILGYPMTVRKVNHNGKPAHYVEGYLLEGYPPADEVWRLAQSLQKTNRRLGFSVEGAVRRRAESPSGTAIVASALVRNVAITNCPVNTDTGLDVLTKSLQVMQSAPMSLLEKTLFAGSATMGTGEAGDGFALRTEHLEEKPKAEPAPRKRKKKLLTKSQAHAYLKGRYPGLSDRDANRVLNFARKH